MIPEGWLGDFLHTPIGTAFAVGIAIMAIGTCAFTVWSIVGLIVAWIARGLGITKDGAGKHRKLVTASK